MITDSGDRDHATTPPIESSQLTRRWREQDSNQRYREEKSPAEPMVCGDSPLEGGVRCELVSVAADEFLESIKKGSKTH